MKHILTTLVFLSLCPTASAQCADGSCGLSNGYQRSYGYSNLSSGGCADGSCGYQPSYSASPASAGFSPSTNSGGACADGSCGIRPSYPQPSSYQQYSGYPQPSSFQQYSSYQSAPMDGASYGGCADGSCAFNSSGRNNTGDYAMAADNFAVANGSAYMSYGGCADGSCAARPSYSQYVAPTYNQPAYSAGYSAETYGGCADGSCSLRSPYTQASYTQPSYMQATYYVQSTGANYGNAIMTGGCANGSCGMRLMTAQFSTPNSGGCATGNCSMQSSYSVNSNPTSRPAKVAKRESMITRLTRIEKSKTSQAAIARAEQKPAVQRDYFTAAFPISHLDDEVVAEFTNNIVVIQSNLGNHEQASAKNPIATLSAVPN